MLAAYNGSDWIAEQLESIFAQRGVDVHVVVRDDGSSDSTLAQVARFAAGNRLTVTGHGEPTGSAAQNFLTLITENAAASFDFVAFADQDDIWHPDKLERACRTLMSSGCAGYSSATIAAWPGGRTTVLRQVWAQTTADFLFEGAGQGCTFVLRAAFYTRIRHFLMEHRLLTRAIHYHDWLIYALARTWSERWSFDSEPSVIYRQHASNDTGARSSLLGAMKRLSQVRTGWYRDQLSAIAELCAAAAPTHSAVVRWRSILLERRTWRRRIRIAWFCARSGRRRALDNSILAFAALAGWI